MNASFHIVGCVLATQPETTALDECIEWTRRYGAETLAHEGGKAVFVQFDAPSAQLILHACRTALSARPPPLRFGFASAIKETGGANGAPRVGERGVLQALGLAAAAQPGQVLLSSQLGSLLQLAELEPHERMRPMRVALPDGRMGSAYAVEPRRVAPAGAA
jgi:hypothetical protein